MFISLNHDNLRVPPQMPPKTLGNKALFKGLFDSNDSIFSHADKFNLPLYPGFMKLPNLFGGNQTIYCKCMAILRAFTLG